MVEVALWGGLAAATGMAGNVAKTVSDTVGAAAALGKAVTGVGGRGRGNALKIKAADTVAGVASGVANTANSVAGRTPTQFAGLEIPPSAYHAQAPAVQVEAPAPEPEPEPAPEPAPRKASAGRSTRNTSTARTAGCRTRASSTTASRCAPTSR